MYAYMLYKAQTTSVEVCAYANTHDKDIKFEVIVCFLLAYVMKGVQDMFILDDKMHKWENLVRLSFSTLYA